MSNRVAISKGVRFEVFKRDLFTCQYCGAHPPSVTLHVDHIKPRAEGGENDTDNLVTACDTCNLGKGARQLSVVPQALAEKAQEIEEREEQLNGYRLILEAKRTRIERESWEIAELLYPGSTKVGIDRKYFRSIKMFIDRLGHGDVYEAADIAVAKLDGDPELFRYFCGVCWKKIRDREELIAD
jgi:HNH endonuclease